MLPIAKKDAAAATGVDVADIPGGGGDEESVNITGAFLHSFSLLKKDFAFLFIA